MDTLLDRLAGVSPYQDNSAVCNTVFLPTGCLQLFQAMHASLQSHPLIACDFEYFADTDVQVTGINAPIVAGKVCGCDINMGFWQPHGMCCGSVQLCGHASSSWNA
jgi:hypothetical protein